MGAPISISYVVLLVRGVCDQCEQDWPESLLGSFDKPQLKDAKASCNVSPGHLTHFWVRPTGTSPKWLGKVFPESGSEMLAQSRTPSRYGQSVGEYVCTEIIGSC
jgi:hypothetical protein